MFTNLDQDSAFESPSTSENLSTSSNSSGKSQFNQFTITCSLCGKVFMLPKVLPCLHSFCFACLESSQKEVATIKCPTCHSEFPVPQNGICGFPYDYAIINFINSMDGKLFCTSCKNDPAMAIARCTNCDHFLCQNCVMAHNYMRYFEGHKIIEIASDVVKDDDISPQKPTEYAANCLTHNEEPIVYFCYTCDIPICVTCVLSEHPTSSHHYEALSEVSNNLVKLMNKSIEQGQNKSNELIQSVERSGNTTWWLHLQYKESKQRICDMHDHYSNVLLKHKEDQLNKLDTTYTSLLATLNNATKASQDIFEKINNVNMFYSRLVEYASIPQRLIFKKFLCSKLESLTSYNVRNISCYIQFTSNSNIESNVLNTFGNIKSGFHINGVPYDHPVIPSGNINHPPHYVGPANPISRAYEMNAISELYKNHRGDVESQQSNPKINTFVKGKHYPPNKSLLNRDVIIYNWKFGSYGNNDSQFTEPSGIVVNAQNDIIVADTNNNRIQVFDKVGRYKFQFGQAGCEKGQLLYPNRVAVVQSTGDIVITERAPTHQVQIFTQFGKFVRKFGSDILQHPRALAVDHESNIIVVECKVMRVIVFSQLGKIMYKFQCSNYLQFPNSAAVNDKKEIFISDNRAHCVIVFDYQGVVLRYIGKEGLTNYPIGVAITPTGEVLVADNHINFNLTLFTQEGQLVSAMESKIKHMRCFDMAVTNDGSVVVACKNYCIYIYRYNY
ncbi:hypothetical protein AAG570_002519 [Ranatra chinensis]|uniref:Uncharacterized protein n=1 Tax=Ranatra chinensis TaxID=642074 RepID=A0ABD0Y9V2_9HEMI